MPEDCLSVVVPSSRDAPNGAPLIEVAVSLNPLPATRTLKRWLTHLVTQKQVLRVGSGRAARYRLPDRVTRDVPEIANSIGQAVSRLVAGEACL